MHSETVVETPEGFTTTLQRLDAAGFRLDMISPADNPAQAVLSRGDTKIAVRRRIAATPVDCPETDLMIVSRIDDTAAWTTGRAGMRYRDLLPGRLGGKVILSNIEVCDGGPVPDLVHHHAVRFQLIFCERGWVDVVYEDQGPPFRMEAGDAVLQPPHIRHRVLASSAGARVIEIGAPAEHDTLFDHDTDLPTDRVDPDRRFGGQRFVRHIAKGAEWRPLTDVAGIVSQSTAVEDATGGLGSVDILRPDSGPSDRAHFPGHDGDLEFLFVLAGTTTISSVGRSEPLAVGDALTKTTPASWTLGIDDRDLRLLRIRL